MSIKLTERALQEVQIVMENKGITKDTHALRVGVSGGGCAGFEYQFGFEEKTKVDQLKDTVVEFDGLQAFIDNKSELYLDGTEIDFHEDLNRRGFVFNNPNAVKSCGCGHSFQA